MLAVREFVKDKESLTGALVRYCAAGLIPSILPIAATVAR